MQKHLADYFTDFLAYSALSVTFSHLFSLNLFHCEALYDVAFFDVGVGQRQAALVAVADLGDIVLLPPQRRDGLLYAGVCTELPFIAG